MQDLAEEQQSPSATLQKWISIACILRYADAMNSSHLHKSLLSLAAISLCLATKLFADTPINELPLYGGIKKSPELAALDQQFVTEATAAAGSRPKAAQQMLDRGWEAIEKQDFGTAIRRFNQASLLAPDDYRVYWGLGTVTGMRGDTAQSEALFEKGAASNPKNIRFLADYGFSIQQSALALARQHQDPRPAFERAGKVFVSASAIDPKAALPHSRMAAIHFYLEHCKEARKEVELARKYGGDGLDPRLEQDIKNNCK